MQNEAVTILTVKPKVGEQYFLVICDGCKARLQSEDSEPSLLLPWRVVELVGWHGEFHACSDGCEAAIRGRYERKGKP